jgi:hypothetical protein
VAGLVDLVLHLISKTKRQTILAAVAVVVEYFQALAELVLKVQETAAVLIIPASIAEELLEPAAEDGVQEVVTAHLVSLGALVALLSLEMVSLSQYPLVRKEFTELSHENISKDVKRFEQMLR